MGFGAPPDMPDFNLGPQPGPCWPLGQPQNERPHVECVIYPNPAQNYIIVQTKDATPGNFTLYNSLGEVVLRSSVLSGSATTHIPLFDVAAGIYHYEVEFANKLKTIGKLSIIK